VLPAHNKLETSIGNMNNGIIKETFLSN